MIYTEAYFEKHAKKYHSGDRHNSIVLTGKAYFKGYALYVECMCNCGTILFTQLQHLLSGHTKSCGCYKNEILSQNKFKHGMSEHPLYKILNTMKSRCYNQSTREYVNYGARGITVCDEWLNDFMSFYNWAMKLGWRQGLEVDRENNDGNYNPENCRIVSAAVQSRNKRNNFIITAFGETKCLADWVADDRCSVSYNTVKDRILKWGFCAEVAITAGPLNKKTAKLIER